MVDDLKPVCVEPTQYHGGSLIGTDKNKVIANATFIFDEFEKILLEARKNDGMSEEAIKKMCANHKTLYFSWDKALSLALIVDPSDDNMYLFKRYMFAAVYYHIQIGCNVTHKVHLMWRHVANQTKYVPGGLGEKMEDWVEHQHQDEKISWDIYIWVVDVQVNADGRAHREHRSGRLEVRAQNAQVYSNASPNLTKVEDKSVRIKQTREHLANRKAALKQFECSLWNVVKIVRRWKDRKDNMQLLWAWWRRNKIAKFFDFQFMYDIIECVYILAFRGPMLAWGFVMDLKMSTLCIEWRNSANYGPRYTAQVTVYARLPYLCWTKNC